MNETQQQQNIQNLRTIIYDLEAISSNSLKLKKLLFIISIILSLVAVFSGTFFFCLLLNF